MYLYITVCVCDPLQLWHIYTVYIIFIYYYICILFILLTIRERIHFHLLYVIYISCAVGAHIFRKNQMDYEVYFKICAPISLLYLAHEMCID